MCGILTILDIDPARSNPGELRRQALVGQCERIREFPPGHYYLGHEAEKGFQRYYEPRWAEPGFYPDQPYDPAVLRKAFEGSVPDAVLWRQKEQFSDGVGYAWIDSLKETAGREVSDGMMRGAAERFPVKTPETKEAYVYRQLFEQHFPSASAVNCVPHERSVACSTPTALAWDEAFQKMVDPSGRAVTDVHDEGLASS